MISLFQVSLALYKYVLLIDQFLPSLQDIENYEKNISSRRNYSLAVRDVTTGLTAFREKMMSLVKVMLFRSKDHIRVLGE